MRLYMIGRRPVRVENLRDLAGAFESVLRLVQATGQREAAIGIYSGSNFGNRAGCHRIRIELDDEMVASPVENRQQSFPAIVAWAGCSVDISFSR
jgi:hypothetical protein